MAQTSTSRITISIATVLALILTLAGQIGPSALPAAAAGPDPTKIPHYFGPWPNWANSPLTTPDVAVAFTGGGGSGAQATATVGADGAVTELTLTDPGGGYTSAPTVEFISEGTGDGAMATATVAASGAVTGVTIDNAGAGYTAPTVSFSGGEGPGTPVQVGNLPLVDRAFATDFPNTAAPLPALVVMPNSVLPAGTLTEFLSWNQASTGGSDSPSAGKTFTAYVLRPTVTNQYSVVYASDLKTVPPLPGDGTVSEQVAYPVNPGVAVQAGDVLAFYGSGIPTDTGVGTDILSFTAPTAPIQGGTVELGSAGYPVVPENRTYSFAATVLDPSLPVTPLSPASATVYGSLDPTINLTDPGSGYTFPTVSIDFPDDPDGVQATAHVVCEETNPVTLLNCDNGGAPVTIAEVIVDNAGSGYSTAPGIAILNGTQFDPINLADGGSAATATSTLKISSIVVDNPGDGYAVAPTVSITDATGSGAGATATATVNTGSITGLTLDAPGSGYVTPGIKKFEDQLPVTCTPPACPTGANDKYIPVGVPTVASYPDDEGTPIEADVYEIGLVQYRTKFHKDLPPTLVRGYVQLMTPALEAQGFSGVPLSNALKDGVGSAPIAGYRGVTPPQYLGPFIAATKDRPVRIVFRNLLPTGAEGDLFLPVDSTMMGSGKFGMDHGLTGTGEVLDEVRDPECGKAPKGYDCFKDNRATLHLHGGITPWISDGTPHQWITPADEVTGYPQGVSVREVPDMSGCEAADDGCQTFFYTNQQSARLMFYHDHAWGITRLNVYAGEAAGYMITDAMEQKLIDDGTIPADQIPLIVQDRTFVPGPDQLAAQDPTWDTDRWGGEGNFWYHHVYMPAQNPGDPSGMSAYGRWMYGPWFWPPATGTVYGPIKNPYFDPDCNIDDPATWTYDTDPYCEPEQIPGTPNISAGMEQFNDTPIVNGVAYPTTTVDPKSYRLRVLNAANDRFFNFQWYIADPDVKNGGGKSEVKLKKAELDAAQLDPVVFPTPDTVGGTLDGPDWVQIGTEGGFLPKPVVVNGQQETTWITDATRFDVGNVDKHSLLLAPAERADAIVDFSKFPGKTLILYNDAPAAFPARIPSYDYYTGAPDLSPVGAPKILPGYGPNTRTIMRVEVRPETEVTPAPAFNLTKLNNAFKHNAAGTGVFESSQHPIIVGQQPYNSAYGTNFATASNCNAPGGTTNRCDGLVRVSDTAQLSFNTLAAPNSKKTIKLEPKAIHDEMNSSTFDDFGRMQANLGIEASPPTPGLQNVTLYPFMNPATEMIDATKLPEIDVTYASGEAASNVDIKPIGLADDGSQLWRVTHNGVDTHPIHFHLYDVQVLNRVTWDNIIKPPDPEELGWKDTVRMAPLEDTIVALRPIIPELPWEIPNSVRLLNPMMDAGSTEMFNNISPQGVPTAPIVNKLVNFGWEYVFHCHILSHEEMDMMRPVTVAYPPRTPNGVLLSTQGGGAKVTWNDNSIAETAYLVQRKKRVGAGWDTVTTVPSPLNAANGKGVRTYVDGAGLTTDTYRVVAENTVGYGAEFPQMTVTSTSEEAVFALTKPTNVAGELTGADEITVTWDPSVADGVPAVTGYEVLKSPSTGAPSWTTAGPATDAGTLSQVVGGLAKGTSWIFRVRAVNPDPGPWSDPSAAVAVPGTVPGAPTALAGTSGPGAGEVSLSWTAPVDNGGTPITGYEVESSPATGGPTWTPAGSVTGTGTSLTVTGLPDSSEVIFQVRALNSTGAGAWSGPSAVVTTLPAAPTGVGGTATPGSTSVSLLWTAPGGVAPITGYTVQKSPAGGPEDWTAFGTVTGSATTLVGTGLLKGTSWVFRVAAVNAGGTGPWSDPSAAVLVATVPGAPSGLTAQAGDAEVALSWTAPTDDGGTAVTSYAVRVFEANSETPLATHSTPDAGTTFTVTGLTNGMAYQFDVAAINAQGTGAPSAKSAPVTPLLVCGSGQWRGEYFASTVLGGTATERCDAAIDFDWGTASPIPGTLPADNFSVRWTTSVSPADGVTWRFDALADDGIRVKVDSTWILDGWKDQGPTAYQGQYTFDGQPHTVTVEYYEKTGGARAKLTMAPGACEGWSGAYYPNNSLTGTPTLIRCEGATLDKNWTAAPAAVLPADNFSVRWTTSVAPADGVTWRFDALADDGIRVKVDSTWIIDGWKDQGPTAYQGQYTFDGQPHTVTVEYYEKTGGARAKLTMAPGACEGWSGAYYPNNSLTGTPTLIRCEGATLDKNWTAAPAAVLPADNFSVRWTTSVAPADGVTWRFDALADDGIRVKVDSTWIIDGWKDQGPTAYQGQYTFDGQPHTVTVEYYEKTGGARAKLTMAPGACEGWSGAYYPNNTLTGAPTLIRCEGATLDKNWTAAPAAVLPADNFSVRWTTTAAFTAGTYRFDALGDDGIRVFVDQVSASDTPLIDGWKDQSPTAYQGTTALTEGQHTITVEYYEKTGGARARVSWVAL